MLRRFLAILILVPLVELAVLFWIAQHSSWQFTLGLVLAAGLAGALLLRFQGMRAAFQVRSDIAAARLPTDSIINSLLIFLAGVLLIVPGVISDALALLLLFPPTRRLIRRRTIDRFRNRFTFAAFNRFRPAGNDAQSGDRILDVQIVEPPQIETDTAAKAE